MTLTLSSLGERIKLKVGERGSTKNLADILHQVLEYGSSVSAADYISAVGRGLVYGTTGTPNDPEKSLRRLSVLLYFLQFEPSGPEIVYLNTIDSRFTYPPKEELREKIDSSRSRLQA
ncbi:MAG: hypothetical protein AABY10_05725 [Nanoarchaeota archaeon]